MLKMVFLFYSKWTEIERCNAKYTGAPNIQEDGENLVIRPDEQDLMSIEPQVCSASSIHADL